MKGEEYTRIQRLIDEGEIYRDGDRDVVAVGLVDDRLWLAVLRRSVGGAELFLKSFRPTHPDQLHRYRQLELIVGE